MAFRKSYIDWIETDGFYIRDVWDFEHNRVGLPGKLVLFPIEKRILQHVLSPNEHGEFPYKTVLYSTTKKSGKTLLGASVAGWFQECAPAQSEIYTIANSLEQAEGRVMKDVKYHYRQKSEIEDDVSWRINANTVENTKTGTFTRAMSGAFKSNAGTRHALTVWDELWGASSEPDVRMWDEMTPIPTVPYSLRFIVTYAGFYNESKLLWDLYLQGVGKCEHKDGMGEPVPELSDIVDSEGNPVCFYSGDLFVYWNHEPTMPWQTQKYYDSQLQSLRPAAYLRLHENRWVTTQETFIPTNWWTDSNTLETSADYWPEHPFRDLPIYIGVDAGVKRDCTAIVGVAHDHERGRIGIVFHKIWTPVAGETLDLDVTVEQYLLKKYQQYRIKLVGYDPTFLYQTVLKLKAKGLPMQEFVQVGSQMVEASQTLFDLLQNRRLDTYPDEQAKQHIQNAVAKQDGRGVRITKIKYSRGAAFFKPVDFVIALAIACHLAVGDGQMNSDPIVLNSPFSDMTGWFQDMNPQNKWLPFALRD